MSRFDEAFKPTSIDDPIVHVRDAVHINGADLRSELEKLPSDLAHYGFEFARAHRRWLAAKISVEEIKAAHSLLIREDFESLGEKATEVKIESRLIGLSNVKNARAVLIETEYEREQLRAICDALRAKRENLQSLVMLARAELAGSAGFREPVPQEP